MGFTQAEQWWEAWQLYPAGSWQPAPPVIPHGGPSPAQVPYPAFRFVTLAAYQGSNKQQLHLEVLWAPILLLHLDGLDGITAYSIQDTHL